jgi:integrase
LACLRECGRLESHLIGERCYDNLMAPFPKDLSQDELTCFLAAIASPRDRARFGFIYHYGLRVGEALMLSVDWRRHALRRR